MPEPDDLRPFFEDFRTRSLAAVAPPGIAAIQRRRLRRRLVRSAAAGLVAVVAVILALGPQWRKTAYPADQPTSSPSVNSVSAAPPTAPAGAPVSPTQSTSPSPTHPRWWCQVGVHGEGLIYNEGGYFSTEGDFFARCPDVTLKMYLAVYRWSPTAKKFVLYRTTRFSLSAAQPKAKKPAVVRPDNWERCGYVALYMQLWPDSRPSPPTALPTDDVLTDPIAQTGFTNSLGLAIAQEWRTWSIAEMLADPQCTPPVANPTTAGPTATAAG